MGTIYITKEIPLVHLLIISTIIISETFKITKGRGGGGGGGGAVLNADNVVGQRPFCISQINTDSKKKQTNKHQLRVSHTIIFFFTVKAGDEKTYAEVNAKADSTVSLTAVLWKGLYITRQICNPSCPSGRLVMFDATARRKVWGVAVAQSVERSTPVEVPSSIPAVAARSLLVGSVTG